MFAPDETSTGVKANEAERFRSGEETKNIQEESMPDERDPRLPPRHPSTGPLQPDTMPDQPKPPIGPSPKEEKEIREKAH
jgi:hypothetical protein